MKLQNKTLYCGHLLSCQLSVTVASRIVNTIIRESIDHVCTNPVLRISDLSIHVRSSRVYKLYFTQQL